MVVKLTAIIFINKLGYGGKNPMITYDKWIYLKFSYMTNDVVCPQKFTNSISIHTFLKFWTDKRVS